MPMYRGRITAPTTPGAPAGASGPLVLSIPDPGKVGAFVTGSLKIGSAPRQALTGFTGRYEGGDTFEARGENVRGEGLDQMHLAVVIRGSVAPDRKTASGTVYAVVNGVEQPDWSFVAAVPGVELPSGVLATGSAIGVFEGDPTALELPPFEQESLLARTWASIPGALKVAAGIGSAALGGVYLYKRYRD